MNPLALVLYAASFVFSGLAVATGDWPWLALQLICGVNALVAQLLDVRS